MFIAVILGIAGFLAVMAILSRVAQHYVSIEDSRHEVSSDRVGGPVGDNAENAVLEMCKGVCNDVATLPTEMRDQFGNVDRRMLTVERALGASGALPTTPSPTMPVSRPPSTR